MQNSCVSSNLMLKAVRKISTALWTLDEIEYVWNHRVCKDKMKDQDHVPLLIYTNANIPGRTEFLQGESKVDPTKFITETAQSLVDGGVSAICIICNTAHYFTGEMLQKFPDMQFLDMIDYTVKYVYRVLAPNLHEQEEIVVGLLGTRPLLENGIYKDSCEKLSKEVNIPIKLVTPLSLEDGNQSNFDEAVFGPHGIKAGYDSDISCPQTKTNFDLLLREFSRLVYAGAQAVIFGCSELPIVLTEERLSKCTELPSVLLVNPCKVLADEVIRFSLKGGKLS